MRCEVVHLSDSTLQWPREVRAQMHSFCRCLIRNCSHCGKKMSSFSQLNYLGKLSYKKNGKKRGHCPLAGGESEPVPFLSPNLPDFQITQKWTFDTTI